MAFDRKTSMYPNYGASGSSEELEAYGVWVKSEPQDMASGFSGVADFPDSSNFTDISGFTNSSDFSTGFDDIGIPSADFSGLEAQDFGIGDLGFDPSGISDSEYVFDEPQDVYNEPADVFNEAGGGIEQDAQGDMSTQLLMKIADELSSIRTELTTLKNEFTGIRAESGYSGGEAEAEVEVEKPHSGFFAEDDEQRVALTGDEMENILSSADLSNEESLPFDPLREEDEAALKRLSEQNEAAGNLSEQEETGVPEEIEFDFEDLGINLGSDEDETDAQSLEASGAFDDFPSLDDDAASAETTDDDPLSLLDSGSGDFSLDEDTDAGLAPQPSLEGVEPEVRGSLLEPQPSPEGEGSFLDESDLSFQFNDLSIDTQTTDETLSLDDTVSLDDALSLEDTTSLEDVFSIDTTLSDDSLSLDDTAADETSSDDMASLNAASSLDDTASDETLSLDDELSLDDTLSLDAMSSLEDTIALENTAALDDALSLDDALTLDDMSSLDDTLSLENTSSNDTLSLDDAAALDDALSLDDSLSLDDMSSLDDTPSLDDTLSMDDSLSLDDMLSLEPITESETDDLGLSAGEGTDGTEPGLDNISLDDDDTILDMNEFIMDSGGKEPALDEISPDDGDAITDDDDTILDMDDFKMDSGAGQEDSLPKVIPEAFETGSGEETNNTLDDDMEVFADEDLSLDDLELEKEDSLAVKAEKVNDKDNGISSEMKEEIKKVLSYMDHLLESLPEDKIEEFAKSEHFDTYKKLFKELGLV